MARRLAKQASPEAAVCITSNDAIVDGIYGAMGDSGSSYNVLIHLHLNRQELMQGSTLASP